MRFFMLMVIAAIASWQTFSVQVSPFGYSLYQPARIYRSTYSTTSLSGNDLTFTANYPSSPWSVAPTIVYSIISIVFNHGLYYQFSMVSKNRTTLTARLQFGSLSKITFCFLIMDSQLYSVSFSEFEYEMPGGVTGEQSFVVVGNENHDCSFLVGIRIDLGPLPSGFAPNADSQVILSGANIVKTNLTISYDTSQLSIKLMKVVFVDFNVSAFRGVDYDQSGQRFEIYGTSGLATDTFMTASYLSMYSRSYFMGLLAIYDGQFNFGPLSLDLATSLTTKIYYFSSEILLVSYHCPANYPITDANRKYCFSGCQAAFYYDGQFMCQPCDGNCLTCSRAATNCTSCELPWVLRDGFVCGCPVGRFQVNYVNGTIDCLFCSEVMSGCYSCSSESECDSCLGNLQLVPPDVCECPENTTMFSKGRGRFCVDNTTDFIEETCGQNFVQEGETCQCTSFYNLTLVKGECVAL